MLRHRGYYQPGVQSPGSQPVMSPGGDLMRIIIADYSFHLELWHNTNTDFDHTQTYNRGKQN